MTLCDDTQYVYFLSATEAGRLHDKKLADEYALHLPAGSVLRQDRGLLGHAPAGVQVEIPHKKPPKRELTFAQKLYSQLLSPPYAWLLNTPTAVSSACAGLPIRSACAASGCAIRSWSWPAAYTTYASVVRIAPISRTHP